MASNERSLDKSAKRAAPQDAPKRYVHMDGIETTFDWKIADYGDDGALSPVDMLDLGHRFELTPDQVRTLSRQLGYALDCDSQVNFIEIRPLPDGPLRANVRKKLGELAVQIAEVKDTYDLAPDDSSSRTEVDVVPGDLRNVLDGRRVHVVRECFYVWEDAGRAVTYTTDASREAWDQIRGPLVEFVRAVVGKVIAKHERYPATTLRDDIRAFQRMRKREEEERAEPKLLSGLDERERRRASVSDAGSEPQ
ncbi:hypothetical protein [Roseivivax marinus]|uniref:hypothetical protein n=1 Tax=Roseivivax marinus TaxID=1379903 RepID=UPI00273D6D7D|nr:hypothetical protein [Roseivivax marinus]